MSRTVTIVVGNPKRQSRTRAIAESLMAELLGDWADEYDVGVVDLADHASEMFAWPSDVLAAIASRVAASDLVVVASPTYKASFTGLLKAFLDRYQTKALQDVDVIALMTGADDRHSLTPSTSLVPLLSELGAQVVGPGLYFVTADMDRVADEVRAAAGDLRRVLSAQPLLAR